MNTIAAVAAAGVVGWVCGWAANLPRLRRAERHVGRLAAELERRDRLRTVRPTPLDRSHP